MYLSGSKWNMRKKRRRSNPWRVLSLVVLIAIGVYFERVIVPTVPPLFIPEPTQTQSPVTFVAEAQAQFLAGKLEQAEQSYSRAIAVNPDEPAHYIELARLQVFQGKYEQAEENASNALLIDENSAMAYAVLAWAMDFNGKYNEAQTKIDYALVLDPNLALAHAYRAEILMDLGLGNYEEALDSANTAVVLDSMMLEAHRALGYVLEMTWRWEILTGRSKATPEPAPWLLRAFCPIAGWRWRMRELASSARPVSGPKRRCTWTHRTPICMGILGACTTTITRY